MAGRPFDRQLPLRRVERAPDAGVDAEPAGRERCRRWPSCCGKGWTSGRRPSSSVTTAPGSPRWSRASPWPSGSTPRAAPPTPATRPGRAESPLGTLAAGRTGPRCLAVGLLPAGRDHARLLHLPGGQPHAENREPRFHEMSHGESFLEVVRSRFDGPGLYVLDEPESALSFSGCLGLVGCCMTWCRWAPRRSCWPPTLRCSPRCPGRASSSSTTAGWRETPWDGAARSWTHRGASSRSRCATCATCSSETRGPRPYGAPQVHSSGRRRGPPVRPRSGWVTPRREGDPSGGSDVAQRAHDPARRRDGRVRRRQGPEGRSAGPDVQRRDRRRLHRPGVQPRRHDRRRRRWRWACSPRR